MSRKVCSNCPNATYSGKEFSPLRFGLSAEGFELNHIMEGHDKLMWITKIKNNKKVWVRYTEPTNKLVHEEPVISSNEVCETQEMEKKKNVMLENVVERDVDIKKEAKKITDYNLFLTYRLQELKNENTDKSKNKELFNIVIAEWKELKKKPNELASIMEKVKKYHSEKLS